jgi:hypothetical protein
MWIGTFVVERLINSDEVVGPDVAEASCPTIS